MDWFLPVACFPHQKSTTKLFTSGYMGTDEIAANNFIEITSLRVAFHEGKFWWGIKLLGYPQTYLHTGHILAIRCMALSSALPKGETNFISTGGGDQEPPFLVVLKRKRSIKLIFWLPTVFSRGKRFAMLELQNRCQRIIYGLLWR